MLPCITQYQLQDIVAIIRYTHESDMMLLKVSIDWLSEAFRVWTAFATPAVHAECSSVTLTCQYQLGGSTFPVVQPLPCSNGQTWSFVARSTPNGDNQVACSVPSNGSLVPFFSQTTQVCGTSGSNVSATVNPIGNTCSTQVPLDAYTGTSKKSIYTCSRCRDMQHCTCLPLGISSKSMCLPASHLCMISTMIQQNCK